MTIINGEKMKTLLIGLLVFVSLNAFSDDQMMNMPGMGPMPQDHSEHQVSPVPATAAPSTSPQVEGTRPQRVPPTLTPDPERIQPAAQASRRSVVIEKVGQVNQKCDEPCLECGHNSGCQNTRGSDTERDTNETSRPSRNSNQTGTKTSPQ